MCIRDRSLAYQFLSFLVIFLLLLSSTASHVATRDLAIFSVWFSVCPWVLSFPQLLLTPLHSFYSVHDILIMRRQIHISNASNRWTVLNRNLTYLLEIRLISCAALYKLSKHMRRKSIVRFINRNDCYLGRGCWRQLPSTIESFHSIDNVVYLAAISV